LPWDLTKKKKEEEAVVFKPVKFGHVLPDDTVNSWVTAVQNVVAALKLFLICPLVCRTRT
jgi:hypothetical protein